MWHAVAEETTKQALKVVFGLGISIQPCNFGNDLFSPKKYFINFTKISKIDILLYSEEQTVLKPSLEKYKPKSS